MNAAQLRYLSEECLSIDTYGRVISPRVPGGGLLDFLTRIGPLKAQFNCGELCCDTSEKASAILVALLRQMPNLRPLGVCLNLTRDSIFVHSDWSCAPFATRPKHLLGALA